MDSGDRGDALWVRHADARLGEPLVLSGEMVKTVWLNVVLSVWPNGNVRQVMCTEVAVERAAELN